MNNRRVVRSLCMLALLSVAAPSAVAQAQSAPGEAAALAPTPELDELESRTMAIVTSGSTNIGSQILGSSRMMAGRTAELSVLDGQVASALPIYGRAIAWERVGDRRIGSYLVLRRYIVRHENMLTVWYLTYINLPSGWETAAISFNDQIQSLNDNW